MRPALALLAALSLAARWADAPCGCAEHNGWLTLAGDVAHHADHAHGSHDEPAIEHDCGGTGRPSFAAGSRVQPTGTTTPIPPVAAIEMTSIAASSNPDDLSPAATPPLRAALKVYRV